MRKTKDIIFDVAIDFIKQGKDLESISLLEIAQAAGIGKSTVYEHFSSKEALIEATYLHLINEYHLMLINDTHSDNFEGSLKGQIKAIIKVMQDAKMIMEAILENPRYVSIKNEKINDEIYKVQASMENKMTMIFILGYKEGIISEKYKDEKSGYIIKALITSLSIQYVHGNIKMSEKEIIDFIYESVIYYLK